MERSVRLSVLLYAVKDTDSIEYLDFLEALHKDPRDNSSLKEKSIAILVISTTHPENYHGLGNSRHRA